VRWDNLLTAGEEERRLPGYAEPARVRTFDAPEALDVRFYEVRARSALSSVPKRSRMPFRWTINPYRGCAHGCTYCLAGDTPILMADGRPRPLADLRVGDAVYGTTGHGRYRRYAITRVLDHWSTVKPAYRVTLEDGTELVASADHRFLSDRGWRYVWDSEQGPLRRPHLTRRSRVVSTGRFEEPPDHSADYRLGYLCGVVRGEARRASPSKARLGRGRGEAQRFGVAIADLDAVRRAREYLAAFGILTRQFAPAAAGGGVRRTTAIRTSDLADGAAASGLIRWPRSPTDEWCKGFLAGIYDAEGSGGGGEAARIAGPDDEIVEWTAFCLRRLEFPHTVEGTGGSDERRVRLRGGLAQHVRFLHTVDPAINHKRTLEGAALRATAPLSVRSVEPLGVELPLFDITTGTGDFIADGVVSHNCFARPTHTYLDLDAGRDFEREIVVKVNAPELVRSELARPSWRGEHVALGTNTDPYQWVESRYRLMPPIWEALRDAHNPCSVLTKSPLLLRDIELLRELAARTSFQANLSVPTLDERAWRATEPHTPHPRKRLEAVAELNRAGVPTGVLVAPLMPGINDAPEQVEPILELASEAGATSIGGVALHLRGEVRGIFFDWLNQHRPDLVGRYEELYRRGAYAPADERRRLGALIARGRRGARPALRGQDPGPGRPERARPAPVERQESLF